jgi:uncharacterized protein
LGPVCKANSDKLAATRNNAATYWSGGTIADCAIGAALTITSSPSEPHCRGPAAEPDIRHHKGRGVGDSIELETGDRLCLSCGLCCDGTLFKSVGIEKDDDIEGCKARGIDFRLSENLSMFFQPCAAHKNGCCKIYSYRPIACQKYKCAVLLAFELGRETFASCQNKIRIAQDTKAQIRVASLDMELDINDFNLEKLLLQCSELINSIQELNQKKLYANLSLLIFGLKTYLEANFTKTTEIDKE